MMLRLFGCKVKAVYSGPDALGATIPDRPAVIFLGIGMPSMDGYEVAKQIREQMPMRDLVLVALTGRGQEEDLAELQTNGTLASFQASSN